MEEERWGVGFKLKLKNEKKKDLFEGKKKSGILQTTRRRRSVTQALL